MGQEVFTSFSATLAEILNKVLNGIVLPSDGRAEYVFWGVAPGFSVSLPPAALLAAFHHLPCLVHLDRFMCRLALLVKYS